MEMPGGGGGLYLFFIVESFLEVMLPGMCSLIHMSAMGISRFLSCLFSWLVKAVLYFIIENRKFKLFYNNNFLSLSLLMADVSMCMALCV